jgi:hypothetical protein
VDWAQLCGFNRGHSAGRRILPCGEGLVTSICLAAAIPVAAIGAVVGCGEEWSGVKLCGRRAKRTMSLEESAAADCPFDQRLSNGQAVRLVVARDSSSAVPMRSIVAPHYELR